MTRKTNVGRSKTSFFSNPPSTLSSFLSFYFSLTFLSPSMRFPFSSRESLIPSITFHDIFFFFKTFSLFFFLTSNRISRGRFLFRAYLFTRLNPIQNFFYRVLGLSCGFWINFDFSTGYPGVLMLERVSAVYNSFENCWKRRFPSCERENDLESKTYYRDGVIDLLDDISRLL